MITRDQVALWARKQGVDEITAFREYLQLLFLSKLYFLPKSDKIFLKGGAALHLVYQAPRFSEDLDFTVELSQPTFLSVIKKAFQEIFKEAEGNAKEYKVVTGKKFLLTFLPGVLPYKVFIDLDFFFGERVLEPSKSILKTNYPAISASYVYHLSKDEIIAEKIRVILTREKPRDIFDLWFLLKQGAGIDWNLVRTKMVFCPKIAFSQTILKKRIKTIGAGALKKDVSQFLPQNYRNYVAKIPGELEVLIK